MPAGRPTKLTEVQIYESEFGSIPVCDRTAKENRLARAEITRDAFLYGGIENAIIERIDKATEECKVIAGRF